MIRVQNERLIGYTRVSTNETELNLQVDALLAHGVLREHLFFDKLSGAREDRPWLAACNDIFPNLVIGSVPTLYFPTNAACYLVLGRNLAKNQARGLRASHS